MNGEGLGGGDCGGGVEGGAKKKEHGKEQPGHFDGVGGMPLRGRLLHVLGNFVRKGIRTFHAICCVVLYTVVLYKFISTLLDIMRFSSSDCWCPYHSVFRKLSRHSHTEHDQDEKIFVFAHRSSCRLFSPIRFSWSRRFIVFHRLFAIHAD